MRTILLSLALLGVCAMQAAAQPAPSVPNDELDAITRSNAERRARDPFTRNSDECGASRYAHLVGETFATLQQTALPANALVYRGGANVRTLEYTPSKLNVVLDGSGRIAAIGCF